MNDYVAEVADADIVTTGEGVGVAAPVGTGDGVGLAPLVLLLALDDLDLDGPAGGLVLPGVDRRRADVGVPGVGVGAPDRPEGAVRGTGHLEGVAGVGLVHRHGLEAGVCEEVLPGPVTGATTTVAAGTDEEQTGTSQRDHDIAHERILPVSYEAIRIHGSPCAR